MENSYTILIVDDSRSIRALLEDIIVTSLKNVHVKTLSSSLEALEYIKTEAVDLILLDINMPVMNGFELAKILKENPHTKRIPIIFITASSNTEEFVNKGFELGAVDYIKKPFDEILLTNKIRSYIKLFSKEKELQHAYDMIYSILSQMDNLVCIIDSEKILLANKTFLDFFGFESLEALREKHQKISDFCILEEEGLTNKLTNQEFIEYLKNHNNEDVKISLYSKKHKQDRVFIIKLGRLDNESTKEEFILSLTDITETEKMRRSFQVQAIIDPLTQIYNRQAFNDKYPKEFYRAKSNKSSLTLMMADIDHFKKINDNYGHQIGDYVLKQFCKIINHTIPNNYFFARWGGEEFMIICKDDSVENVLYYANLIREKVQNYSFLHVERITSSFGVARLQADDSENDLLARLDEALYQAKANGRNQVVLKD